MTAEVTWLDALPREVVMLGILPLCTDRDLEMLSAIGAEHRVAIKELRRKSVKYLQWLEHLGMLNAERAHKIGRSACCRGDIDAICWIYARYGAGQDFSLHHTLASVGWDGCLPAVQRLLPMLDELPPAADCPYESIQQSGGGHHFFRLSEGSFPLERGAGTPREVLGRWLLYNAARSAGAFQIAQWILPLVHHTFAATPLDLSIVFLQASRCSNVAVPAAIDWLLSQVPMEHARFTLVHKFTVVIKTMPERCCEFVRVFPELRAESRRERSRYVRKAACMSQDLACDLLQAYGMRPWDAAAADDAAADDDDAAADDDMLDAHAFFFGYEEMTDEWQAAATRLGLDKFVANRNPAPRTSDFRQFLSNCCKVYGTLNRAVASWAVPRANFDGALLKRSIVSDCGLKLDDYLLLASLMNTSGDRETMKTMFEEACHRGHLQDAMNAYRIGMFDQVEGCLVAHWQSNRMDNYRCKDEPNVEGYLEILDWLGRTRPCEVRAYFSAWIDAGREDLVRPALDRNVAGITWDLIWLELVKQLRRPAFLDFCLQDPWGLHHVVSAITWWLPEAREADEVSAAEAERRWGVADETWKTVCHNDRTEILDAVCDAIGAEWVTRLPHDQLRAAFALLPDYDKSGLSSCEVELWFAAHASPAQAATVVKCLWPRLLQAVQYKVLYSSKSEEYDVPPQALLEACLQLGGRQYAVARRQSLCAAAIQSGKASRLRAIINLLGPPKDLWPLQQLAAQSNSPELTEWSRRVATGV